jgi:hypothetical protein
MKFQSWIVAVGTAVVAGSALTVAAAAIRKVACDVEYAARSHQQRLLEQLLADEELRTAIFPGISRVHVGINEWVMYHRLMLRSGTETWERFEVNARMLLSTPAGQAYWAKAKTEFQHVATGKFDQRFLRTLQAAASSAPAPAPAPAGQ